MVQSSEKPATRAPTASADTTLDRSAAYFENEELRGLISRATDYARAGVCIHFTGTAGVGKTSLALRVAEELERPVSFMAGNEWLTARDFIGREVGSTTSTLIDRYVQSVRRTEKTTRTDWQDSILGIAMEQGHTLIYDEFTRASPEANSTLLSVLEEGILVSTDRTNPRAYLQAHPDFRIILTSNPHDYLANNSAPDALMDRVLTMPIEEPGVGTLTGITAQRTGLAHPLCARIVESVVQIRQNADCQQVSALRSAILIARIAAARVAAGTLTDFALIDIATDVLLGRGVPTTSEKIAAALTKKKAA